MNAHQEKDTKVMSNGHHSPTMKNKEINGSSPKMHKKRKWCIPSSDMSRRTVNPIRRVVDTMRIEPNPSYSPISLSIGMLTNFYYSLSCLNLKNNTLNQCHLNSCVLFFWNTRDHPDLCCSESIRILFQ